MSDPDVADPYMTCTGNKCFGPPIVALVHCRRYSRNYINCVSCSGNISGYSCRSNSSSASNGSS